MSFTNFSARHFFVNLSGVIERLQSCASHKFQLFLRLKNLAFNLAIHLYCYLIGGTAGMR